MIKQDCFPKDQLRDFALGNLTEPTFSLIETHLADCEVCEETIVGLDRHEDTLIGNLRNQPNQLENGIEPELVRALNAAKASVVKNRPLSKIQSDIELPNSIRLRDYELLEPIGCGGMGVVYKARHLRLHRDVAVKILPFQRSMNGQAIDRFEREMKAVGQLHHPSIVQATDAGDENGIHYLAMEYIDGIDLQAVIKRLGPISSEIVCHIIYEVAKALAHAHEQGVIHRDIKPSNLMITSNGEVKLLDLGLALLGASHGSVNELTTVGQLMGTIDYMAPEQFESSHEISPAADIYSLGATAFKLITGTGPFESDEEQKPLQKLKVIATTPPKKLQDIAPGVSDHIADIIDKCLERSPENRFADMHELADAVEVLAVPNAKQQLAGLCVRARSRQDSLDSLPVSKLVSEELSMRLGASQPVVTPTPVTSFGTGRNRIRSIAFAFGLFAALATVIVLMTNTGELTITTSDPSVEVKITRNGDDHTQFTMTQSKKTIKVATGEYKVELLTNHDTMEVKNGEFRLRRGDKWVAKIVHKPTSQSASNQVNPSISTLAITELDPNNLKIGQRLQFEFPVAPELNREVMVLADGSIHLPMVGLIKVAGGSFEEAEAKLDKLFAQFYGEPESFLTFSLNQTSHVSEDPVVTTIPPSRLYGDNLQVGQVLAIGLPGVEGWTDKQLMITSSGKISLPYVGVIDVVGRSVIDIEKEVRATMLEKEIYHANTVEQISISLTPSQSNQLGSAQVATAPSNEPTYQSKTFGQWKSILRQDRDLATAQQAIEALSRLGTGGREDEAADEILQIAKHFEVDEILPSAVEAMRRLRYETIDDRVMHYLKSENAKIRQFTESLLTNEFAFLKGTANFDNFIDEMVERSKHNPEMLKFIGNTVYRGNSPAKFKKRIVDDLEAENGMDRLKACEVLWTSDVKLEKRIQILEQALRSDAIEESAYALELLIDRGRAKKGYEPKVPIEPFARAIAELFGRHSKDKVVYQGFFGSRKMLYIQPKVLDALVLDPTSMGKAIPILHEHLTTMEDDDPLYNQLSKTIIYLEQKQPKNE